MKCDACVVQVLKTRLVLRKTGQYANSVDCAQRIWRHEGVRGFYRGFLPNVIGILPYAGIDLAIYEVCCSHIVYGLSVAVLIQLHIVSVLFDHLIGTS